MKKNAFILAMASMFVLCIGCEYKAPITEEHSIKIDPAVLGVWEEIPGDGKADKPNKMLILRYSDTEYVVCYPAGVQDSLFFKAYPAEVGGVKFVQTKWIGTGKGGVEEQPRRYQAASYKVADGVLEFKLLNTALVDKELGDTAALKAAFLKHKDSAELFTRPVRMRRISDAAPGGK